MDAMSAYRKARVRVGAVSDSAASYANVTQFVRDSNNAYNAKLCHERNVTNKQYENGRSKKLKGRREMKSQLNELAAMGVGINDCCDNV